MNENRKATVLSGETTSLCFARCEDIAFSLMASAKDSGRKHLFKKLYESFKYSDKVSTDSQFEVDILYNLEGFSKAINEGQYSQLCHDTLEQKINEFISSVSIRNKRLLESKRGAY